MNKKYKDESVFQELKEKKIDLIYNYRDKLDIKYKRIHDIKTPKENISNFFTKTSFVKNENKKTPIIKLNQTNFRCRQIKTINLNILEKSKMNSSFGLKKNKNKIPNLFLVKLKENKYFSPINRNKSEGLCHSPSFSNMPQTMREKILLNNDYYNKFRQHFHNISYIKNNNSLQNQEDIIKNLNKSNSQKDFNIRQKFFFHRNNTQKMLFNKSFQSFSKTSKNANSNNKNTLLNSLTIKELNPKISEKDMYLDSKLKRMHGIDIKIKELLEKNDKGDDEKVNDVGKEKKEKKEKYLQQLARYYDNLPSLIIKKNIEKEFAKPCKIVNSKDFSQNFHSKIGIVKKEENQKDEFDRLIQNNPTVKYIFLQNILNSLVHKVKLFGENKENLVINSNTSIKLNGQIQDFITYGYEFIPEDFLKNKNFESPKDLLKNQEFINIILKTKTSIDNTINRNTKENYQNKEEFDIIADSGIKIYSKNIMNRFNKFGFNKGRIFNKDRFIYKRINLDKLGNNKILLDKSTNYDYNNKSNNNSIDKSVNSKLNTNLKNNTNEDGNILSQLFDILYENINDIDEIIRKDKIDLEKKNNIEQKEKFWRRLLQKNENNEIIYNVPKKKRTIKSGKKRKNKLNYIYNKNYLFEPIKIRKIKTSKKDKDYQKEEETDKEIEEKTEFNIKSKKNSTYNIYYKNKVRNEEEKNSHKKRQNINLIKKTEKVTPKLENIPEANDIFDSYEENKEKDIRKNKKYKYIIKKTNLRTPKKKNKSREEKKESQEKKGDSFHTSFNLEDILNKNKEGNEKIEEDKIEKKEEEKGEKEDKKIMSEEKDKKGKDKNVLKTNLFKQFLLRYNSELRNARHLSKLIDKENKNKKIKRIKINEIKEQKEQKKRKGENILVDKYIPKKKEEILFFNDMKGKSLEDIEKKKIELLYKFKHDIKYKISTGGISSNGMENFEEFQEKINKLKNKHKDYDINDYIKVMEQYFQSFKEEMENNELKKIEEDRINKYLRQYHEDYNTKIFYKDIQDKILCKVVNYSQINHINSLNQSQDIAI